MAIYYKKDEGFKEKGGAGWVEISEDEHQSLMRGQALGQAIAADGGGKPYLTPIETKTTKVSMRQARLALHQMKKLNQVDAAIGRMPAAQAEVASIEWEYASTIDRNSALTQTLATMLNLTETETDELFELAGSL